MDVLNCEQKVRSASGCAAFLLAILLAGAFIFAAVSTFMEGGFAVVHAVVFGMITAVVLVLCFSYVYGFVKNEVWRFGIRDNAIWWDSPRWPRSKGVIPLANVCEVTIWEARSKVKVTMRDGTSRYIPYFASARHLRAVLSDHYSHVGIKFIEGAE